MVELLFYSGEMVYERYNDDIFCIDTSIFQEKFWTYGRDKVKKE